MHLGINHIHLGIFTPGSVATPWLPDNCFTGCVQNNKWPKSGPTYPVRRTKVDRLGKVVALIEASMVCAREGDHELASALVSADHSDIVLHQSGRVHGGNEMVQKVGVVLEQLRSGFLHHSLQPLGVLARHSVPVTTTNMSSHVSVTLSTPHLIYILLSTVHIIERTQAGTKCVIKLVLADVTSGEQLVVFIALKLTQSYHRGQTCIRCVFCVLAKQHRPPKLQLG